HDRGDRANLQRLADRAKPIAEQRVRHGEASAPLGEFLASRIADTRDGSTDTIERLGVNWPGGNYANTGLHAKPGSYEKTAWARALPPLTATPHSQRFMGYPASPVPPHLPVFDGSIIYVNAGEQLVAYDLVNGGRGPLWSCKPFPTLDSNWRTIEPDPNMTLPVSTFGGTVFAALENPLSSSYHQ